LLLYLNSRDPEAKNKMRQETRRNSCPYNNPEQCSLLKEKDVEIEKLKKLNSILYTRLKKTERRKSGG